MADIVTQRVAAQTAARQTLSRQSVLAATFGLAATVIAMLGSWIPSLWGDEVASLQSAQRSWSSLALMLTHVDAVHGAYYVGLHLWISAFGASPFSIRLPSAIAVGFAAAAVVVLADRLSGRSLAIIAGIVFCVLPRTTYMGEEARSFAFSTAIAAWLTVLLVDIIRLRTPPMRLWVAYGLLLLVGMYVFIYIALIAAAQLVILVLIRVPRRKLRQWFVVSATALAAAAPLVVLAYLERSQIAYLTNQPQVTFASVFVTLWFTSWILGCAAWSLILIGLGAWLWKRRDGGRLTVTMSSGSDSSPQRLPRVELVAAVWCFLPAAILILGQLFFAGFTARYLSYCAPAAALLIACGIRTLAARRKRVAALLLTAVVALAAPVYIAQRGPFSKNDSDLAQISSIVGAHAEAGDAIVFDGSVTPSRRPRLALHAYPKGFAGLDDVALRTPYPQNRTWYDATMSVDSAYALGRFDDVRHVWLVEYSFDGVTDTYGIDALADHGFRESPISYGAHSAVIYEFSR